MEKQSARLYYDGKDHKEIYFQGNYHRAMYKGDRLVWMKMGGKIYAPFVRYVSGAYHLYLYYPETKSAEKILDLSNDAIPYFNEKFMILGGGNMLSPDGKNFVSSENVEYITLPTLGGSIGVKSKNGKFVLFLFSNDGKISKEVSFDNDFIGGIIPVDYFRDYLFSFGEQYYNARIFTKDGRMLREVSFLGGKLVYYANVNGKHIILCLRNGYVYVYESKDLYSWSYSYTGIKVAIDNFDYSNYRHYFSCIFDGEKYLIYVIARTGSGKKLLLLYETNDFEIFVNVPLPLYMTINGTKENSTSYYYTDEEKFREEQSDLYYHGRSFFQTAPYREWTLLYDDGMRMNPCSFIAGGVYVDNLYFQDSENNMLIDFLED